jgi:Xaa-Pro aminopeptidase
MPVPFTAIDFPARLGRVRARMHVEGFDHLVVAGRAGVPYLANVQASPGTCLVLARDGACTVVTPGPGRNLADAVAELVGKKAGTVGLDSSVDWRIPHALLERNGAVSVRGCDALLGAIMAIKEPAEIERMRMANNLADIGYTAVLDRLNPEMSEYLMFGNVMRSVRAGGSDQHWSPSVDVPPELKLVSHYPEHGMVNLLDHYPSQGAIREDSLLKFGLYPRFENYCGAVAATVCFGRPPAGLKALGQACAEAAQAAIDAIRPGAQARDVHRAYASVMEKAGYGDLVQINVGFGIGTGVIAPALTVDDRTILVAGMALCISVVARRSAQESIVLQTSVLVTDDGRERLNQIPLRLIELH